MNPVNRLLRKVAVKSGALVLALRSKPTNPLIFMYHGVTTKPLVHGRLRNYDQKHVQLDTFIEQLKIISRWRHIIPLNEMVEGLRCGDDLTGTVAITFDDGYENNFLNAAPVLSDFKAPATFFLATGMIGVDKFIWTDQLEHMLDNTLVSSVTLPLTRKTFSLTSSADRKVALREIKAGYKLLPLEKTIEAVMQLGEQLKVDISHTVGDYCFMNWYQAKQLVDSGFEVGAHTVNHPILSRISLAEAKREILESRDCIVEKVGNCSKTFCYPNGRQIDYTPEIEAFCREHFRAVLTTSRGLAFAKELYSLRRIGAPANAPDISFMLLRKN